MSIYQSNNPDTTRAACYQIILEGRYGSLPPVVDKNGQQTFWRVAASNTENDFCSVNTSSLALLRRFCHLSVMPQAKEVIDYLIKQGVDFRVPAFLSSFSEDLFPQKFDEKLIDNKANPFPSTWHALAIMINKIKDIDLIYKLSASCVGAPVAAKFQAFVKMMGKLDIDKIIADPEKEIKEIKKLPESASMLYAVVYSIGNCWIKKEKGLKAPVMAKIAQAFPAEFGVTFSSIILSTRRSLELTSDPAFCQYLTKIGVFFDKL
jgi:hypothetical protein